MSDFETEKRKKNTDLKISVIMPVYKVEDYVAKAIESVLAQKNSDGSPFQSWELIAVDDGSPDKSGEICDSFAEKDSRIKVIHQKNSGAPAARNRAIDIAAGKYLMFLDSDDYCEPTMLSDMYELAEKNNSQLVISGFFIETYCGASGGKPVGSEKQSDIRKRENDGYIVTNYIPEAAVYDNKEDFRNTAYRLFDRNMLYPPWNKLYLKDYMVENKLYFPQTFWDDFPFVLSVIRDIERVSVTDWQYYHFLRERTESETQKYVPKMYEKREEEHSWMVGLYKHWNLWTEGSLGSYGEKRGKITEASREMIARRYIDRLIGCFENLTNPKCKLSKKEKRALAKQMLESKNTAFGLRYARPRSLYSKIMYLPLKWKNVSLTLAEAGVITWVKNHNTKIFTKLKAGR